MFTDNFSYYKIKNKSKPFQREKKNHKNFKRLSNCQCMIDRWKVFYAISTIFEPYIGELNNVSFGEIKY